MHVLRCKTSTTDCDDTYLTCHDDNIRLSAYIAIHCAVFEVLDYYKMGQDMIIG